MSVVRSEPDRGRTAEAAIADGPVFIGGLDRSGKTTMRAFLASHPRIAIPAVGSNMETFFHGRFGSLGVPANLDRCLEAMVRYKHVRFLQPDVARIRAAFAAGPATYERLFALFLMQFAEREGKPRWGAQTGLLEAFTDELVAAHPGARFVHMIRDPRDRYEASLAMWPDGKGRAGGAVARWRYSTALAERNVRRYPEQVRIVRFEDLIRDPEAVVREMCAFLSETFDPAMLAMPEAPTLRAVLREGAEGSGEGAELLSERFIGPYRGVIEPRELAFFRLAIGGRMRRFGYEAEAVRLGIGGRIGFLARDVPNQSVRMLAWTAVQTLRRRLPRLAGHAPKGKMVLGPPGASG